jgi:Mg/Co/Ni transporter MgtE
MVLSDEGLYRGKLEMADLLTGDPESLVADVMKPEADTVRADA